MNINSLNYFNNIERNRTDVHNIKQKYFSNQCLLFAEENIIKRQITLDEIASRLNDGLPLYYIYIDWLINTSGCTISSQPCVDKYGYDAIEHIVSIYGKRYKIIQHRIYQYNNKYDEPIFID